jgi:protein-tyrosine phosphatase
MSRLHWIEIPAAGRIAISARPRADDWLETEVAAWKVCGLDMVVSLLEREEVSELGLQREAELCQASAIEFISFPIPDRGVPETRHAMEIASTIANGITNGRSIAIHCRAGIGRSSVIAACALICSGIEARAALALIKEARGVSVPDTEQQRDWIIDFGKVHQAGGRRNMG